MSQFEQGENMKFCQKLGESESKTFQMIKEAYGKGAVGCSDLIKWHKNLLKSKPAWKMMSIPVSQEPPELSTRSKKISYMCIPNASKY